MSFLNTSDKIAAELLVAGFGSNILKAPDDGSFNEASNLGKETLPLVTSIAFAFENKTAVSHDQLDCVTPLNPRRNL